MASIRTDESGVKIRVDTKLDLSGNTGVRLVVQDPVRAVTVKTGVVFGPAVDGIIEYEQLAADFQMPGEWLITAEADFPGSDRFKSDPVSLLVKDSPASGV